MGPPVKIPRSYQEIQNRYPDIAEKHAELVRACKAAGPIDPKTAELVKLGIAVGAGLDGGTHSHARQALDAGATPDEIRHVVLLATSTLGMSRMLQARRWVEEILNERS